MVYFSEFLTLQKVPLSVFSLTKILISSSVSVLGAWPPREKWLTLFKPTQFNFFYLLHKTIFLLYNWLITFSCRHFTDIKTLLTQNLLIMQNPDAEHRTCTASQYTQNAQYKNKYINSHSAKQNWKNKKN